jgi:amino acid transporter
MLMMMMMMINLVFLFFLALSFSFSLFDSFIQLFDFFCVCVCVCVWRYLKNKQHERITATDLFWRKKRTVVDVVCFYAVGSDSQRKKKLQVHSRRKALFFFVFSLWECILPSRRIWSYVDNNGKRSRREKRAYLHCHSKQTSKRMKVNRIQSKWMKYTG